MLLDVLIALPVEALQLAHDTSVPHHSRAGGGGVSVVLILVGVVVTGALVGALVWLKGHMRKLEERERSEERTSAGVEGAG
jgi:hypothetical protein